MANSLRDRKSCKRGVIGLEFLLHWPDHYKERKVNVSWAHLTSSFFIIRETLDVRETVFLLHGLLVSHSREGPNHCKWRNVSSIRGAPDFFKRQPLDHCPFLFFKGGEERITVFKKHPPLKEKNSAPLHQRERICRWCRCRREVSSTFPLETFAPTSESPFIISKGVIQQWFESCLRSWHEDSIGIPLSPHSCFTETLLFSFLIIKESWKEKKL